MTVSSSEALGTEPIGPSPPREQVRLLRLVGEAQALQPILRRDMAGLAHFHDERRHPREVERGHGPEQMVAADDAEPVPQSEVEHNPRPEGVRESEPVERRASQSAELNERGRRQDASPHFLKIPEAEL